MRLALCQINPTVGDLAGNTRRIVAAVQRAADGGATLAVLPELCLCGYPPRDLLDRRGFIDEVLASLDALVPQLPREVATIVGTVDRRDGPQGPRLYNAAALIAGGSIQRTFHKRLLPTYDVFDEHRYFSPGNQPMCFDHEGTRIGVTICEDAWNDQAGPLRGRYDQNPVALCVDDGASLILNIAASPFTLEKRSARSVMLAGIARAHERPLVFVNQAGGNDDLIFDGNSSLHGPDGAVWASVPAFAEHIEVVDLAPNQRVAPAADSDAGAALDALIVGTRDYADKCGFESAVLGLSGGIDSALVAAIAASAFEPARVLGVAMPTRYSSEGSLRDARAVAEGLGLGLRQIDVDPIFEAYLQGLGPELDSMGVAGAGDTTEENLQARIRGNTLMAISNRFGHLLLTTGNKSELAVGYCTLYGDMAGGLAVISDLPKTFVYEVAREVNRRAGRDVIPQSTLDKPPSAELKPDQKDEDSLPPYDVLDAVLDQMVAGGKSQAEIVAAGFDRELVARIASMVKATEYKRRQMPPGLIVTSKAFGPGRRYPIAQKYRG